LFIKGSNGLQATTENRLNFDREETMRHSRYLFTVVGITFGLLMSIAPAKAGGNQEIIPINANAYGNTYGEWSARWWQYMYSIPAKTNPILDTKGKF
jgi:hypothetical protein